jgi:hypothetical protein
MMYVSSAATIRQLLKALIREKKVRKKERGHGIKIRNKLFPLEFQRAFSITLSVCVIELKSVAKKEKFPHRSDMITRTTLLPNRHFTAPLPIKGQYHEGIGFGLCSYRGEVAQI